MKRLCRLTTRMPIAINRPKTEEKFNSHKIVRQPMKITVVDERIEVSTASFKAIDGRIEAINKVEATQSHEDSKPPTPEDI